MHQRRHAPPPIRLGPFELDLRARELRRDGRRIHLQDKPFELLATLVQSPGEIVGRDELRQRLWSSDTFVVFDDGLNTAISKVRDALGDSADAPRFIQTVPRHGYRYIGPIETNGNAADAPGIEPAVSIESPAGERRRRRFAGGALIAGFGVVLAATSWWVLAGRRAAASPAVLRFDVRPPASTHFPSGWSRVAVSADGRQVAFCAISRPSLAWQVWIQSLDSAAVRPLPGTEAAEEIAWSPDAKAIAFRTTTGTLHRYRIEDGIATPIAETGRDAQGITWSATAGILFGGGRGRGLARAKPEGGPVEPVSTLDHAREEIAHAWPQFLPDGRTFIYIAISRRPEWSGLYLARIGDPARRLVRAGPYKAKYVEPGLLVYGAGSSLLAQRFDIDRAALTGEPVEAASDVIALDSDGAVDFSVSAGGILAYGRRARMATRELVWVNRAGQRIVSVGRPGHYASFRLSPDRRWAAVEQPESTPGRPPELWLLDLASGARSRVTHSPGNDEGGAWSPDSQRFAYARHPDIRRPAGISVKSMDDPEKDVPLLDDGKVSKHPFDWSPDGRFLLYGVTQPGGTQDIWVLTMDGSRAPQAWLATPFNEAEARFSPDGKWVAYESNQTGRTEIFVRSFDPAGSRWQISPNGGSAPQWSADGTELYFIAADHHLTTVAIGTGSRLQTGPPRPLFELRRLEQHPQWPTPYAVSRDNQRFLIGATLDEGGDSPIGVVLNWMGLVPR